jgi:hypothetical protein
MSHVAYASPLVLEPGHSRYLIGYLVVIHALALAVLVAPLNLSLALRVILTGVVVISFIWQMTRRRPHRLIWEADGEWQLLYGNGNEYTGQLRPDSYVSTLLVILRFRLEQGGRCTVVMLPDMLDSESFRRLRVRLHQARLADAMAETGM